MYGDKVVQLLAVLLLVCFFLLDANPAAAALKCFDCHGTKGVNESLSDIRPEDAAYRNISSGGFVGSHRNHVASGATSLSCEKCHPGSRNYSSAHRNGMIHISPAVNLSRFVTSYNNRTTSWPQTAAPTPGNCTNVNCHFEKETLPWGASVELLTCTSCHSSPPADGSHGKKHGDYFGTGTDSCARCHTNHLADANIYAHASSAGKRGINVLFTAAPNSGGSYSDGSNNYPDYLAAGALRNGSCTDIYCHSDGRGGAPVKALTWSDTKTTDCYTCHRGRTADSTADNCADFGTWSSAKNSCTPDLTMSSDGHHRLVGPQWIRKYPCSYCHAGTVDEAGVIIDRPNHVNGVKNVQMPERWAIVGKPSPSYDSQSKVCDNVYCHSDGSANPEVIRPFAWTEPKTECNTCHGHPNGSCDTVGCHDGRTDGSGKVWTLKTGWPLGQEWKAALPMYESTGHGTARANSHQRHVQTDFTCDQCHYATAINGICTDCHADGIPAGSMSEVAHLNGDFHVNKAKEVVFRQGGSYDPASKTCSNTNCHSSGTDPQWGGSVNSGVICLNCHGVNGADVDSFSFTNYSTQAKINLNEWVTSGHGRPAASGPYPASGNPAANFPGNPCWYCHDNNVYHNDESNPFRLRQHPQFSSRYDKECVYCHMVGEDNECLSCHNSAESLAPQLGSPEVMALHSGINQQSGCRAVACHDSDATLHNSGAGLWTPAQQADVKSQYLMMGVCLKCHDDDSGDKCTSCHANPTDNPFKYSLGFDPGTGFIKPQKAQASSVHFGYKHNREYVSDGIWRGGKFCWDCHDPHGDSNIYMIQAKVSTTTDGVFGIPKTRSDVVFTRKQSGLDYARIEAPYNGICNVCHAADSKHYRKDSGDGHNASRVCTTCHEHRFTDSHADKQSCSTCHLNKPVPRHTAFGLPRNCVKCHSGTINKRIDIMGQMKANSHHVQGVDVSDKHCYACHWEATPEGLINVEHHQGFNFKNYSTVKNAVIDLVVWKPGIRPTYYNTTTAVQYLASDIGTVNERASVSKITTACIACHSDQNNDTTPFNDCKTPRQYAWDGQSVAARYAQTGTTSWGKYNSSVYANANQKDNVTKAFSAHGNAVVNEGGYSQAEGLDANIPNSRGGLENVQCYDCHSSHGSKVVGITTSYVTFNGTRNGGNLKETQAGKGGYAMSYKASANTTPGAINPYSVGAGQCFDCHTAQNAGTTPWGYESTFGASQPIKGYSDSDRFGQSPAGFMDRSPYKAATIKGGHLKASSFLNHTTSAHNKIDGLCTPCHDPHGISPTLGSKQVYAVPLLKGTWLTSPYKEDIAPATTATPPTGTPNPGGPPSVFTDQKTFNGARITENDDTFAGLCLRCHAKGNLTNGTDHTWKSQDRIHEAVKGWKTANGTIQHNYTCSKCHSPHTAGLPRLMQTDCLSFKHRGRVAAGGQAGAGWGLYSAQEWYGDEVYRDGSFPRGQDQHGVNCHPTGSWPDNSWNSVTPW